MEPYSRIQDVIKSLGYNRLLPLQEKAFQMPELYEPDKNIFITGNTSSGKTLIPLLHYILEREENPKYKMLFLVPYRALATQKKMEIEELLHKTFPELKICISTGELREDDRDVIVGDVDVAVIIYEKAYHFACSSSPSRSVSWLSYWVTRSTAFFSSESGTICCSLGVILPK